MWTKYYLVHIQKRQKCVKNGKNTVFYGSYYKSLEVKIDISSGECWNNDKLM